MRFHDGYTPSLCHVAMAATTLPSVAEGSVYGCFLNRWWSWLKLYVMLWVSGGWGMVKWYWWKGSD
ncbi:hypothetical protein BO71DRAFT_399375 [Aspergillus ellipticus CBS 707.79]|uniref:Uncharacterized protein n=1 Tax=Aspergillus ellipticus CBS 707.79 TaxID=1448320 RepID=A0A319ES94_9EURO|nr:hypothetical protein BO71DRAFT_399375 [Aspergillus ellipticus CBS 707.79]